MLRLFRRKANQQYLSGAAKYLKEKYEPTVQYCIVPWDVPSAPKKPENKPAEQEKTDSLPIDKPQIKYSLRVDEPGIKHSRKQSYNSEKIDQAMGEHLDSDKDDDLTRTLNQYMNSTFVEHLYEYIRQKNLKDPDVYKAAQLDRRLFSKIMSDTQYKPAKDTAVALAFALKLSLEEAEQLLQSAGYVFSHSIKRDVIIEYFFRSKIYDLSDINAVLYRMGQKEIGR